MVSFPAVGRMGNFLFEASCALAYALKHGLDFTVPFTTTNEKWSPIYLKHLQNEGFDPKLEKIDLWEGSHIYEPLPFEESWRNKNIIIQGYRQSWKYIDEYRNEILYAFDFPYEKKEGYVSVHVRRTDYLQLKDKHPQIGRDFYENAMGMFPDFKFKFFSDDIDYCRKEFGNRVDCEFSSNNNEVSDLIEASCCTHNILSSSTFGWWQGWLNRNSEKKIIIPNLWFVENYNLSTVDIVPPEWIKL